MRLFIATQLPPETAGAIEKAATLLRQTLPARGWVRPGAYHITWAFLGEHETSAIEPLEASLHRLSQSLHSVPTTIAGAGFFPSISRARVGWLALAPADELRAIASAVRQAIGVAHVSFDEKPFAPHLSIVRMRQPWQRDDLELFVREMGAVETTVLVDHLSLFKSELHPEGPVHSELARVRLLE
jgi:2'-5' RNA ligase